jgi:hypothetical protein
MANIAETKDGPHLRAAWEGGRYEERTRWRQVGSRFGAAAGVE